MWVLRECGFSALLLTYYKKLFMTTKSPTFFSRFSFFKKNAALQNRIVHRWLAIIITLPMIFILITGIFLQVRKPVDWIQPPAMKGSEKYQPTIALEQVLTEIKTIPEMQVDNWSDIKLLDLRPKKGIIKVRNHNELETQVDATTGEILQVAQRRNDFITKMHDFSAWHARLWLGLPVRIGFLVLFLTGVYLNIKMLPAHLKAIHFWRMLTRKTDPSASLKDTSTAQDADVSSQDKKTNKDGRPLRLRKKSWLLKYHYWLGWIVIIPWAFVITSGLLLQVRYEVPWVMPVQQQGQGTVPEIEFVQVLETARQLPEYDVQEWKDVWRIYVYPNKGITTVRAKNRQELQIDSSTGEVLQVAIRRLDWLENIHEGKWMGLNLWLFLPVHILSLILWLTGTIVAFSR